MTDIANDALTKLLRSGLGYSSAKFNQRTNNTQRDFAALKELEQIQQKRLKEYKVLLDHLREVVFQTDALGNWVFLNRAWTEISGFTLNESLGKCFLNYVHPADRQRNAEVFQPVVEGKQRYCRHEVRFTTKTGQVCWVDMHAQLTRDERGEIIGVSGTLTNISQRKQAEEALRQNQEQLKMALSAASMGAWEYHVATQTFHWSDNFTQLLGMAEGTFDGSLDSFRQRVYPDDLKPLLLALNDTIKNKTEFHVEFRLLWPDGSLRWMAGQGRAVPGDNGWRLVGIGMDITQRKLAEEQLKWTAQHDPLTALPNRSLFLQRLDEAINRHRRAVTSDFAVLYVDLDKFKLINDTLGHAIGDELLIALSRRLEACVRPYDTVGRMGGDEFTVLIENIHNFAEARRIADRIQQALSVAFQLSSGPINVSASIGVAISSSNHQTADDFLRSADRAMYDAKGQGKGLVAVEKAD